MLKYLLLASGIAAASQAHAEAKMWATDDCSDYLYTTADGGFEYVSFRDGEVRLSCEIGSWPTSSPVAAMSCEGGEVATFQPVSESEIIFQGIPMQARPIESEWCD